MISIPFSGSKRYSYKEVKAIVEAGDYDTVIEPFGGSGVLSVNLYNDGLVDKAIINDYDGIFDIYEEFLDYKDWLNNECFEHGLVNVSHSSKGCFIRDKNKNNICEVKGSTVLQGEQREFLQSCFTKIPKKFWKLFSYGCNYCHSAVSSHEEIKLCDWSLFSNYVWSDKQRRYLFVVNKCTLESLDYKDFMEKYKSKITQKTLLILDPPYHNTAQYQYKEQFNDKRTQELIDLVKTLECDFVFFNAQKENIEKWLEGLDYELVYTGSPIVSANHKRKDIMAYVRNAK